jgi:hypothetical protein
MDTHAYKHRSHRDGIGPSPHTWPSVMRDSLHCSQNSRSSAGLVRFGAALKTNSSVTNVPRLWGVNQVYGCSSGRSNIAAVNMHTLHVGGHAKYIYNKPA